MKFTVKPEVLQEILLNHALWLDHKGGSQAELQYNYLENVDLSGKDLRKALLDGANLSGANLQGANLQALIYGKLI